MIRSTLITGGNNVITATPGSIADLQIADDTWDTVYGSNVDLELTYAQATQVYSVNASIVGGDDTIQLERLGYNVKPIQYRRPCGPNI